MCSSDLAETDASHTAAIDRTPIVRVKLVAPGEDNGNVVKTAIIKIHIVRKTVVPEINITETKDVTLKHINQVLDMDMDKIFNHKDVQLSKDEFRKTYEFVHDDRAQRHKGQQPVRLTVGDGRGSQDQTDGDDDGARDHRREELHDAADAEGGDEQADHQIQDARESNACAGIGQHLRVGNGQVAVGICQQDRKSVV